MIRTKFRFPTDSNTNTGIADIDDGDKMVNGDGGGRETIPVDEGMDADGMFILNLLFLSKH